MSAGEVQARAKRGRKRGCEQDGARAGRAAGAGVRAAGERRRGRIAGCGRKQIASANAGASASRARADCGTRAGYRRKQIASEKHAAAQAETPGNPLTISIPAIEYPRQLHSVSPLKRSESPGWRPCQSGSPTKLATSPSWQPRYQPSETERGWGLWRIPETGAEGARLLQAGESRKASGRKAAKRSRKSHVCTPKLSGQRTE